MVVHYNKWSERRLKMYFFVLLIDRHKQCKRMVVYYDKRSESHLKKERMFFVLLMDRDKQCQRKIVHYDKSSESHIGNVLSLFIESIEMNVVKEWLLIMISVRGSLLN